MVGGEIGYWANNVCVITDRAGSALIVKIDINIRSMGPISELDMAYSMDCYFRQRWQDKRLAFEHLPGAENLADLPVAIRMLDRIWKPDTYFYNGKKSYIHTVTTPNKFFRISPRTDRSCIQ
ncbi:PREDICTED: gamma-aminobutyric acid receptor alpha-like [Priapulus caudatus]|uniref:Gamma-aminobutyric acid receptor alpha-like n=1 Tax=Priapulus caudatus TaxID=37621 RepID=A0ABM1F5P6_PRICU|nr:PREDICTED: gamma-aminobutyric acid receptor alpha-like [Priapulus caudatus]